MFAPRSAARLEVRCDCAECAIARARGSARFMVEISSALFLIGALLAVADAWLSTH